MREYLGAAEKNPPRFLPGARGRGRRPRPVGGPCGAGEHPRQPGAAQREASLDAFSRSTQQTWQAALKPDSSEVATFLAALAKRKGWKEALASGQQEQQQQPQPQPEQQPEQQQQQPLQPPQPQPQPGPADQPAPAPARDDASADASELE